jgi:hypothetical protein
MESIVLSFALTFEKKLFIYQSNQLQLGCYELKGVKHKVGSRGKLI